ncbi:MAG: DinB family protein [Chloroflexi bacterium]|nr:DinB family protein [Chloroflexota bacterium]
MNDPKPEIIQKLNETRAELMAFLRGLDEAQWETAVYSEGETWTAADVARHLTNAESGMTGLIVQWQMGNDPVPPDFDLARFNQSVVAKAKNKTPDELLAEMEANRANLLQVIDGLEEDDWQINGRHASLQILTIEQTCHLIADHEATHLQDLQAGLGV